MVVYFKTMQKHLVLDTDNHRLMQEGVSQSDKRSGFRHSKNQVVFLSQSKCA